MAGAYVYTPEIWPPLLGAAFVAAIGLHCWRRRRVPAALPLLSVMAFGVLWLLGIALETAAVAPSTKIAWFKFQSLWRAPIVTAGLCFVLEYAYPGRWLTRRNLILLSVPVLLDMLLIVTNSARLMWQQLEVVANGSVVADLAPAGVILAAYGVGLVVANTTALVWLFVHSPQHRWPVTIMLLGHIASRGLYVVDAAHLPWPASLALFDPITAGIVLGTTAYAVALFGFHILDPLPAAYQAAIEQMCAGVVVFDPQWRVLGLNPTAESVLGARIGSARGKTWQQLASLNAPLPALPDASTQPAGQAKEAADMTIRRGSSARQYAPTLSALEDFRGLCIGHLLMLQDVTEQRQAQLHILEQQRTLAALHERERLARELHDGLGQVLAAAHLQASTAKLLLDQGQAAQVDECLGTLAETTLQAEADVRDYLLGAKTLVSPEHPFFAALRDYLLRFTRQYGLPVELVVPPELEAQGLTQPVEAQLLRIIQEALSNVRKHARARCAQVVFSVVGAEVSIVIADDGQGFDVAAAASNQGFGLQAMRERAEELGGSLSPVSGPGQGTQVIIRIPFEKYNTGE